MSSKILFFAASRNQKQYFSKLAVAREYSELYWYKSIPFKFAFRRSPCFLAEIQQQLVKTENAMQRKLPVILKGLLAFYWQFCCAFLYGKYLKEIKSSNAQITVVWNGLKIRQQVWCAAAKKLDIKIWYMENGLLPGYTTLDPKGVNFYNSMPREFEFYQALTTKASLSSVAKHVEPETASAKLPRNYIFFPFQVNSDSQVVLFSPFIKNMAHLTEVIIAIKPVAEHLGYQLLVKPHPKEPEDQTVLLEKLINAGVFVDRETNSKILVDNSQAVITINSTVGMEALQSEKKVIVLGQAFYSVPGLCLQAFSLEQLGLMLQNLNAWQPDVDAIHSMFNYLANHYQVKGNWRECSPEHIDQFYSRLEG